MLELKSSFKKIKDLASRLSDKNKYERILKDYAELAEKHQKDMRIRLKIAETYFRAKDYPNAIATYQQIGEHYIKENFIMKAIVIYQNILKLDPSLAEVNIKLAELYQSLDMIPDATNQYRIAMQLYSSNENKENLTEIGEKLVAIDPSPPNLRKLGEIYQSAGHHKEALEQFQKLAQIYRVTKNYDDLLRILEIILPHKSSDQSIIKDICILYLRRQEPEHAIRTMERYKVDSKPEFASLYDKAKIMQQALRAAANKP